MQMTLDDFEIKFNNPNYIDMWYYRNDERLLEEMEKLFNMPKSDVYFDGDNVFLINATEFSFEELEVDFRDIELDIEKLAISEYQKEQFLLYDKIVLVSNITTLISDNDVQFVIGGSYHHLKKCGIVDGRVVVSQTELPTKI